MGRRIVKLPDQPTLKDDDYLVIDGEDGTRKVLATESIILSGVAAPSADQGVSGSMYIQYNEDRTEVLCIYFKISEVWLPAPKSGGSYAKELEIENSVASHSTITVVA